MIALVGGILLAGVMVILTKSEPVDSFFSLFVIVHVGLVYLMMVRSNGNRPFFLRKFRHMSLQSLIVVFSLKVTILPRLRLKLQVRGETDTANPEAVSQERRFDNGIVPTEL